MGYRPKTSDTVYDHAQNCANADELDGRKILLQQLFRSLFPFQPNL